MATETLTPDGIVASSNLNNPTNVQTDNTSWATAQSNNSDSVIHVSFPSPSGDPSVGAGLQNFTVKYRVTANGSSVTFTADLYENGVLASAAIDSWSSTSTTEVTREIPWNASLLGTANGSAVELLITATKSGGSPSNRTTGEFQFIDWDVDYATAPDACLADDVQSTSEVSVPTLNTEYGLLADDVQSTSNVSIPTLNTEYTLTATSVESASELTTPSASETDSVDDLLANDVESSSSVTTPNLNTEYGILANDVESTSEVTTPSLSTEYSLTANSVESGSEITNPALNTEYTLLANDVESSSQLSQPALADFAGLDNLLANDVGSFSELTTPSLTTVYNLLADGVGSVSQITTPTLGGDGSLSVIAAKGSVTYYAQRGEWFVIEMT